MQKKIIALAVAAALTAPAMAFAEVTVYGLANLSMDMVSDGADSTNAGWNGAPVATKAAKTNQLVNNNSRLGFKGSQDLGGGLSAIFQIEGTVGMDSTVPDTQPSTQTTQVTGLFNRNTWLGLKSADFGSVMAGINDTVYKTATRRLDVFGDQVSADNRSVMGVKIMGSGHDVRLNNTLTYVSPKLANAFTIAASTVFGAEVNPQALDSVTYTKTNKGSLMSLAGMYDQGPIYAAMAYQTYKIGAENTGDFAAAGPVTSTTTVFNFVPSAANVDDKSTAFKLGGSYNMGAFTVGAVYETMTGKVSATNAETKGTNYYLTGKFAVGAADAVKLAYGKRGETKTTGSSSASQNKSNANAADMVAIGYDHAMSKSTTVYALYAKATQKSTAAAKQTPTIYGNFDPTSNGQADPSAFSIGMKYVF